MIKTLKKNIFRSPYQSLAAVLIVSLALFLINVFFLVGVSFKTILNFFESRPQVIAYLKDETKPQQLELLIAKIRSNENVKDVAYLSKDDALKTYKELFKDKPALLEMVTAKYLPASIEVSANNIASLKTLAEFLKNESIVEDIDFQEDIVSTLSRWLNSLKLFGFILAGFLLFVSVLVILVVLGMKISQRKEEIEALKLIGASAGDICLPLYCEGVFYGFSSALISWSLCYLLILYFSPALASFLSGIPLFPVPVVFMLEVLGGMIVLGSFVGFFGSLLAVSRFLRASR